MKKFSKEVELEIINLYKKGYTQKEIAEIYNTFNTSIRRVLLRNNVYLKGNDKQQRLCKHNPFKNHDEWSEYFLGLLITGGNIDYSSKRKRIRISLNERDGYLIEEFLNHSAPEAKITKTLQKLNNSYMWSASITNLEALNFLERKGNFHNKSFEAKLYTPITYHILRGIIDGDGGVYQQNFTAVKFSICGKSLTFIKQIEFFLVKEGFFPIIYKWHDLYYIQIVRVDEVLKLGQLLYKDAHIFCKRKYEKWLAFYESRRAYTLNSGKEMAIQP